MGVLTDSETIAHLEQVLSLLVRRLRVLEMQATGYGSLAVPPHILLECEDVQQTIARTRAELRRLRPDAASPAPYFGLATFQEDTAGLFFGRDALVAELVERARATAFLAVLGASGSGKSSVVRAGLIPALKGGALPGSATWRYVTLKPGARPIDALATELAKLQAGDLSAVLTLSQQLLTSDRALLLTADLLLDRASNQRLVLLIDQFEELWTLASSATSTQQTPFLQQLLAAITLPDSPVLVVLTMRADFLHRAAEHPELARAIGAHDVIVSPMDRDDLHAAIVRPSELASCDFEPGLVEELVKQVHGVIGALPLLEYTLLQLWKQRRQDEVMTWETYRALGGVEGALAAQADDLLKSHYSATQQNELRGVLVQLVRPGEGEADTRRRIRIEDLVAADEPRDRLHALLQPLIDERLLTTGRDSVSSDETIELTHEALIRAWPTLRTWVSQARADLRFQLQFEDAAKEWQTAGENSELLWSGLRLSNTEAWMTRVAPRLNRRDQAFLAASRTKEREQLAALETVRLHTLMLERRARRRLQGVVVLLSVVLLASGYTVYRAISNEVQRQRAHAEGELRQIQRGTITVLIERYEVTNARWARCVAVGVCIPPPLQISTYFALQSDQMPVTGIDGYQAAAFCRWIGRRLPTRAEWSYAATHGVNDALPWGPALPSPMLANLSYGETGAVAPVGHHAQGASQEGVEDLIGNVQEWTATAWHETGPDEPAWDGDAAHAYDQLVVIGGGYLSSPNGLDPQPTSTYSRLPDIGFRCVEGGE